MTGSSRTLQIVVLGTLAVLIIALCAIAWVALKQHERGLLEAVGVATVPPPDRSLANAKLRGSVARFFGPDSYPDEARDAGQEGLVRVKLQVAATGRVEACRIEQTSRSASLDRRTCEIARQKVRFEPARDRNGVAIASSYNLAVRWQLSE